MTAEAEAFRLVVGWCLSGKTGHGDPHADELFDGTKAVIDYSETEDDPHGSYEGEQREKIVVNCATWVEVAKELGLRGPETSE